MIFPISRYYDEPLLPWIILNWKKTSFTSLLHYDQGVLIKHTWPGHDMFLCASTSHWIEKGCSMTTDCLTIFFLCPEIRWNVFNEPSSMRNWLLKNAGLDSNTFKTLVLFLGGALEKYSNTFSTTKHFEFVSISQHARKQHFHVSKSMRSCWILCNVLLSIPGTLGMGSLEPIFIHPNP